MGVLLHYVIALPFKGTLLNLSSRALELYREYFVLYPKTQNQRSRVARRGLASLGILATDLLPSD
jgi:hypothetical protein